MHACLKITNTTISYPTQACTKWGKVINISSCNSIITNKLLDNLHHFISHS